MKLRTSKRTLKICTQHITPHTDRIVRSPTQSKALRAAVRKSIKQVPCACSPTLTVWSFVIPGFVRLVNGRSLCSGRVEVYPTNGWTAVCDADFDWQDAEVVCRELDCGVPAAIHRGAHFGEGQGSIWSKQFQCQGQESLLHSCSTSAGSKQSCSHSSDVGLTCTGYTGFRLVNGTDSCSGRVELQYLSEWGTVCGHYWDLRDASALCRQLNCGFAVAAPGQARFGEGSGSVWADVFECQGNETRLSHCAISSWGRARCAHGDDAGVICSGFPSPTSTSSVEAEHELIRLAGGGGPCAGRLEVYHSGSWGTVCDDSWDLADSQVVCRQLQCGMALSAPVPASLSQGTGPIWLDEVGCLGNESSLWECPSAGWGQHDCGHKEDVTILCSEHKQLRLSEGCSGLAEVYYNGTWGSVCFNGMEKETVSVICRQLGCGDGVRVQDVSSTAVKWLDLVKCRRHDSTLWQCPSAAWGQNDCTDEEAAEISCSVKKKDVLRPSVPSQEEQPLPHCPEPLELRLTGPDNCSGRVEVRYEGSWGTVCDDSWDLQDAQVVCRQLGCGDAMSIVTERNSSFGRGSGAIWLDEVTCTGSERHLWDCCHSPLNQSDCRHKEDAGVICAGLPNATISSTVVNADTKPLLEGVNIPALVFLVLCAVLFVVLALLVGQLLQNRKLKKALSEVEVGPLHEAVYEEIEYKLAREGTYSAPRRGRLLSDELPSDYDDVEDSEGDAISGESRPPVTEEAPEDYDDAVPVTKSPDGLPGSVLPDELPTVYDDVGGSEGDPVTGESRPPVREEAPEDCDDAAPVTKRPDGLPGVPHAAPAVDTVLATLPSEGGPPAPDRPDYDDVGDESLGEDGRCDADRGVWKRLHLQV
ncbi:scavenger receptor cysteine-rich type 1 protein M130 [Amia ocellicauda]|uniref:scavenger receptor cysteine-rich type 1 protein M130 n=1 Tax=Amia ocellicauda TaxID=2972642 RepID=UPI0034641076